MLLVSCTRVEQELCEELDLVHFVVKLPDPLVINLKLLNSFSSSHLVSFCIFYNTKVTIYSLNNSIYRKKITPVNWSCHFHFLTTCESYRLFSLRVHSAFLVIKNSTYVDGDMNFLSAEMGAKSPMKILNFLKIQFSFFCPLISS